MIICRDLNIWVLDKDYVINWLEARK